VFAKSYVQFIRPKLMMLFLLSDVIKIVLFIIKYKFFLFAMIFSTLI